MAKQVAKKASKKAASKKAASKKEEASTAWNAGKTMTLHGCKVQGRKETFRSVWAAFQALGMGEKSGVSRGQHIRFRAALKKLPVGKSMTFVDPRNEKKKHVFTLVKPTPV